LLGAARAGLDLYPDIARLAQAIYEAVKGRQPDPDDPGDGFADRGVRLSTTIGGAGRLHGDLSAPCAALLGQVFATLGKSAGSDDLRGPEQRNHDALEAALGLALAAPGIPRTSGMKTRATALMSLRDLLRLDGADDLCEAWLSARGGEPGWLFGPAARAAACAGQVTPVITGTPDWDVLGDMAGLFLDAHGLCRYEPADAAGRDCGPGTDDRRGAAGTGPPGGPGRRASPGGSDRSGNQVGDSGNGDASDNGRSNDDSGNDDSRDAASRPAGSLVTGSLPAESPTAGARLTGRSAAGSLSGPARLALERTLLRMAIRAVAGPGGVAGFLRSRLLGRPFSGASLILDAGATDDIPDHIRRAVMLRDRHCQWPGGCDRPASQCEPHHRRPRADGGDTSTENLDLYCRVHHHHYIHRAGWTILKHPDGTRQATSPAGRTLTSHGATGPR
jgi:hypothetical protein